VVLDGAGNGLPVKEVVTLAKEINSKVTLSGGTFELKNVPGHLMALSIQGMHSNSAEDLFALVKEFTIKSQKVLGKSEINKKRISEGKPAIYIKLRERPAIRYT